MHIRYRIALMFICLTIGIVLLVSSIEYFFANQNSFEDFYKRLEIRAIIAGKIKFEEAAMAKGAFEEVRKQHLETLPSEQEYFIPVDDDGNMQYPDLQLPADFYTTAVDKGFSRHRDHNIFYLGHLYKDKQGRYLIIISARNEFINLYLGNLRNIIIISILASLLISALAGLWFSNLILNPIRVITQKMRNISATQMHLRLTSGTGRDEIAKLADTFNNMLDRLESTFETQKNFISNASHELNTPLTAIIGESEYALSKPRTEKEYAVSLDIILKEAERLRKITNSLLQLAQTGFNGKNQEFEKLRVDEVIFNIKEIVDNIIPDNKVYVNLNLMPEDEKKLLVKANLQLLEIALANIILNGCKYSMNQPVSVTIAAAHKKVIIIVEDHGIGIPREEIAYIYEPFFRASNTSSFNGYGIGLPLARNIIRMHSGELEVTSEENVGTKIKITFPQYTA